ncbi:tumor necrosis factor receptor superfamily member 11B [Lepisosteus oculatus]|uniref:TNF receptor superfamily member 11b n=1 Tax=Lepisosteus oculatus TaxID=7918 RepID=W5MRR6_LEPOC|nr:PREDICTED: tumor necrosis factor receptor superfamily member 11B [Lepisosteus oculatus]
MGVSNLRSQTAMKLHVLFAISFTWAFHEVPVPKYQHWDPVASQFYVCDQCPPGTALQEHCSSTRPTVCSPCPEHHFSEHWHWDDKCQYCTTVCKEKQRVRQECNSTHNRICECIEGYHLEIEFCVKHTACQPGFGVKIPGTPESDTVCEICPNGYYSSRLSTTEQCTKHTNCTDLGFKTSSPGTATQDAICESNGKGGATQCFRHHLQCHSDITLCEEAIFQFIVSQGLSSLQLDLLIENLPGKKVDNKKIEKLRKTCSPKQQILHLLKLWVQQNKDQDSMFSIIQGVNHCERVVSRCAGFRNLTLSHLTAVMDSLPGNKVKAEDIKQIMSTCESKQYILQLLQLWKMQNGDQDIAKGLSQSIRKLRRKKVPKRLLKSIKKIIKIFNTSSIHKLYEKMFLDIIQGSKCLKSKSLNE